MTLGHIQGADGFLPRLLESVHPHSGHDDTAQRILVLLLDVVVIAVVWQLGASAFVDGGEKCAWGAAER